VNAVLPLNSPARIYWIVGSAAVLWLTERAVNALSVEAKTEKVTDGN
jgi:hypothetical protein